jgi:hypothetical protein
MAVGDTNRVLRVFLGSPGDLSEERAEVKGASDYTNKLTERSLRWRIQLYGWEDTMPTFGRPQERINKEVDECDLFIGMLWKRWGEPTAGGFSSGFHEEFVRALQRRQSTGAPEIWLWFKDIDPSQLADPGEQLQRVLAFRKEQREAKQLLYKEFSNIRVFRELIREALPEYVLQLATDARTPRSPSQAPGVITARTPEASDRSAEPPAYTAEISKLAETLRSLASGHLEAIIPRDQVKASDAARLYLVGKSVVSSAYTSAAAGVHELNLAYKHIPHVDLSPAERRLIFRSMLVDNSDIIPIWLWFSALTRPELQAVLAHSVWYDVIEAVRTGALDCARGANLRLSSSQQEFTDLMIKLISDDGVRAKALEYLTAVAKRNDISILKRAVPDSGSPLFAGVQRAKRVILYRVKPAEGFKLILKDPNPDKPELELVKNIVCDLPATLLRTALAHPSAGIREIAGRELLSRNQLSTEQAAIMSEDENPKVREVGLLQRVRSGETLDIDALRSSEPKARSPFDTEPRLDLRQILREQLNKLPQEQLMARVDWWSLDGPAAYEVLGDRFFDERAPAIRSDLAIEFAELKAAAIASWRQSFPSLPSSAFGGPEVHNFVRDGFIAAGLRVLAKHGESSDRTVARKFIANTDQRIVSAVVAVLSRFGEAEDVDGLIDLALASIGELRTQAAEIALRLSPGLTGAAQRLIRSGDITCILTACEHLQDEGFKGLEPLVGPLAERAEPGLRLIFAWFMTHWASRKQRVDFLRAYVSRDSYYYNVVCWLDRTTFAPPAIRRWYLQRLDDAVAALIPKTQLWD